MPKKRYLVMPRSPQAQQQGIDTPYGHRNFAGSKLWLNDPAVASEIDQSVGLKGSKDVWVHEDPGFEFHLKHDGSDGHDRDTHFYTFGGSTSWADAWEAFEQRRTDKGEQHG